MQKILILVLTFLAAMPIKAQSVSEKLNRAPVAVMTKTGVLVSWRSLSSDGNATFSVKRNGETVATAIADVTNWLDADGKAGDVYTIESSKGDEATVSAWSDIYSKISIPRPASIKSGNTTGRYRPDDCSVADLDGDGDYELIVKWMPDNARDNGSNGYSSPCIIDAYDIDWTNPTGTLSYMWRINLGLNIRSGNHYTPFLCYDFDGDGKAEMICKTASGSKDGQGQYVSAAGDDNIKAINNEASFVNGNGHVTGGEEFLTVFNGATGAAMNTIWYSPNAARVDFPTQTGEYSTSWDKNYNRGHRYNAAVAYLDGTDHLPSAIMQRGYYNFCYIWAVDWDGTQLKTRWLHRGTSASAWSTLNAKGETIFSEQTNAVSSKGKSSYGQGVHGISVGDVDDDGNDEIVIGAATIDHDGKLLCSTGFGHGDAIHLGHLVSGRPGMQVMMPHEEGSFGYDVHDAATGEIIAEATGASDNGRGLACDFIPANPGWEFWSSFDNINNTYSCADNSIVLTKKADTNFRIYWTGDPYDQSFDGRYDSTSKSSFPRIRNFNTANSSILTFFEFAKYGNPQTCNTTKATPCLQADLLGDWREELILTGYESDWSASTCDLLIYSTPEPTRYKLPCLMEDHLYRMGIVWQNSSYNQPPHLGYSPAEFLGINGSSYKTQTATNAPDPILPPAPSTGNETVTPAATDRAVVTGVSYTTDTNMMTASTSNGYVKMRVGENGGTWKFTVNDGYIITGVKVDGYSNNDLAAATIDLTSLMVDETQQLLSSPFTFKPKSADSFEYKDFEAKKNIIFTFDSSNITGEAGIKNKQIMAIVTFTYKTAATGITATESLLISPSAVYNLKGQRVLSPQRGEIYIRNGKKFMIR